MRIKKIAGVTPDMVHEMDKAFDALTEEKIANCNWPEEYPYSPDVRFRMFHTGDWLMLRFEVHENHTAALVTEDGGEVWTDSCVEFFFAADDVSYYNLEATCIGKILLSNRKSRTEGIIQASGELLGKIVRIPSFGSEPFSERTGDNHWTLTLAIPPQALFRHSLNDWSGAKLKMNLYKCGDRLSVPHFLSWMPIGSEQPDFHRPEYFSEAEFE